MINTILNFLNNNSAAVTAVSILMAGVVWVLKIPFEKHCKEIISIAKMQKLFSLNEVALRDNIAFLNEWSNALSASRPYSCHFETLITDDTSTSLIGDLKLINKLLKINYMMKRSSDDLSNLYNGYWEVIPKINSIIDNKEREENLKVYHGTIQSAVTLLKGNLEIIHKEILPVIAHLQVAGDVRFHSLYGYMNYIFLSDVYPRPTERRINLKLTKLESELGSIIKK